MKSIRQMDNKLLICFFKLLVARIRSKSPKFYVTMRWIAGLLAFVAAIVLGLYKINVFHVIPDVRAEVMSWCQQIGSALSAVFLFTWTGTADPELIDLPNDDDNK